MLLAMEPSLLVKLGAALVMAVGLVGIIVPSIPGLTLIWLGGLGYGLLGGFDDSGIVVFVAMSVITVVGGIGGFVLPGRAAQTAGAGRESIAIAVVCAVIGFFAIPVVGLVLGGVGGLYAAEYIRTRDRSASWRSTKATLIGFGVGAVVQLTAGLLMIVAWLVWALVL